MNVPEMDDEDSSDMDVSENGRLLDSNGNLKALQSKKKLPFEHSIKTFQNISQIDNNKVLKEPKHQRNHAHDLVNVRKITKTGQIIMVTQTTTEQSGGRSYHAADTNHLNQPPYLVLNHIQTLIDEERKQIDRYFEEQKQSILKADQIELQRKSLKRVNLYQQHPEEDAFQTRQEIGSPIKLGDEKFDLILNIMVGIKKSISSLIDITSMMTLTDY